MATRQELGDTFARFYAPLAIGTAVVPFLPLFEDVTARGVTQRYGSLIEIVVHNLEKPTPFALLPVTLLVMVLLVAAFRTVGYAAPVCIAVLSALLVVLLFTKPGTNEPTPPLAIGGMTGLVLAIFATLLAIAHIVALSRAAPPPRVRR